MEFLVLGPLHVLDAGQTVTVAAPRQRALLAALLVHANEVVSTDGKRLASVVETPAFFRVWAVDTDELIVLAESRVFRTFTAAECQ